MMTSSKEPRVRLDATSADLVRAVQRGDRGAADQLVLLWRARVLGWARFHARRGVDPDDVAQDVLLRVRQGINRVRRPEAFRSFLYRVVIHVVREHERAPALRRWVDLWLGSRVASEQPGPYERVAASERLAQVHEVLRSLPSDARTMLWLAYVEEVPRNEIAAILGCPVGTLNRKMTQARASFDRLARRRGLADGDSDG